MNVYGDHALLCCGDPGSAGFQLRHCVMQQSLVIILREDGNCHDVEPSHLRLELDASLESGRDSGLATHADIVLYCCHGDSRSCVDLVSVPSVRRG